jgi:hypothetical protein
LWELKQLVTKDGIAPDKRAAAREQFANYERALAQARSGLPAWEKIVASGLSRGGHVQRTLGILRTMSEQMQQTATALGV